MTSRVKRNPGQISNTLQFLDNSNHEVKSETFKEKKTEKSVHFASENEQMSSSERSVTESVNDSQELISWVPSEYLYSDDTFIPETSQDASGKPPSETTHTPSTAPSYGTSSFIELDSEDETREASDFSLAESLTSDVFTNSGSGTYREWKDVTEIVKDIEELEESEFVTQASGDYFTGSQEDYTDFEDSLNEEIFEQAKQDFVEASIQRLRLGSVYSPHSHTEDLMSSSHMKGTKSSSIKGTDRKEEMSFCQKMIKRCQAKKADQSPERTTKLHTAAQAAKHQVLEHYGVSSELVDRLKFDNFCQKMDKKAKRLDLETEKSLKFVQDNLDLESELAKEKFISQILSQVQNEKMEEKIQEHLIRMHPVVKFAEFVSELPACNEDSREILYKYKRLIQRRMEEDVHINT